MHAAIHQYRLVKRATGWTPNQTARPGSSSPALPSEHPAPRQAAPSKCPVVRSVGTPPGARDASASQGGGSQDTPGRPATTSQPRGGMSDRLGQKGSMAGGWRFSS